MGLKLRNFLDAGWRATLAAVLFICVGFIVSVSGQDANLFDTGTVERSLKNQYRLTTKELKMLRPFLRQQNQELVIAFDRCLDEEQTDYFSLWTKVLTKREEFEAASITGVTPRQRQIIRTARLKFELRILNEWRSLYVEELASFLELDWYQATILERIFRKDQEERLMIIAPTSQQQLESSWQKLSEELDKQLERVLSRDQLKDYRKLNAKGERLVA